MTEAAETPTVVAPPRVRWWRRRPPASLQMFSRVVWWAGQGQILFAPVSAVLGVVFGVVGFTVDPRVFLPWAYLLAGAAGPFIVSGLMLRAFATSETSRAGSWSSRILSVVATVIVAAGVWVVLTFVAIELLLYTVLPLIESLPWAR